MAKPIRSTPELKGEEADKFLKKMLQLEKTRISDVDKKLAQEIELNSKFFKSY